MRILPSSPRLSSFGRPKRLCKHFRRYSPPPVSHSGRYPHPTFPVPALYMTNLREYGYRSFGFGIDAFGTLPKKPLTFVPGQPTRPQIVLHRSTWKDRRLVKFSPCRVVYNIPATCQPSPQQFSYWYALPKYPDSVVLAPAHLRSLLLDFSIIVPSSFTSFPMTFRPWCL